MYWSSNQLKAKNKNNSYLLPLLVFCSLLKSIFHLKINIILYYRNIKGIMNTLNEFNEETFREGKLDDAELFVSGFLGRVEVDKGSIHLSYKSHLPIVWIQRLSYEMFAEPFWDCCPSERCLNMVQHFKWQYTKVL